MTADLRQGQKVFIHAGAGGVGTFAIQLAKHLGADVVIDYRADDFEIVLHDHQTCQLTTI